MSTQIRAWVQALGVTAACLTLGKTAWADTRFVGGPGASDQNPGTAQAPFATLQKAADEAAAGDTFSVRAGSYSAFFIRNGGLSSSLRVVFQRDPSAASAPIIQGGVTVAANFVTLDGFEVRGAAMMGVNVYGASNLTLKNNLIHDNQRGGVYAAPAQGRASDDILLDSNDIYANSLDNSARTSQGGWAGAVQMSNANRLTLEHNRVHENWGEGISFTQTQGSVARHNIVYDNYSVELYMDHAIGCSFEANLVFETGNASFFRNLNGSFPANGVQIANEPGYDGAQPGSGNRIVNNIIVGGRTSLFYWRADGDSTGLRDTLIANNTFYGAREALLKIEQNAHQGSRIVDNLFAGSGGKTFVGDAAGVMFDHNAWPGAGAPGGPDDVTADCGLAKPGGHEAVDYRLTSMSSPCVGRGVAVNGVTDDFWGGARSGRVDLGAHQFGSMGVGGTPAAGGAAGNGGMAFGGSGPMSMSQGGVAAQVAGSAPVVTGGATMASSGGGPGSVGESGSDAQVEDTDAGRAASCSCRVASGGGGAAQMLGMVVLVSAVVLRRKLTPRSDSRRPTCPPRRR